MSQYNNQFVTTPIRGIDQMIEVHVPNGDLPPQWPQVTCAHGWGKEPVADQNYIRTRPASALANNDESATFPPFEINGNETYYSILEYIQNGSGNELHYPNSEPLPLIVIGSIVEATTPNIIISEPKIYQNKYFPQHNSRGMVLEPQDLTHIYNMTTATLVSPCTTTDPNNPLNIVNHPPAAMCRQCNASREIWYWFPERATALFRIQKTYIPHYPIPQAARVATKKIILYTPIWFRLPTYFSGLSSSSFLRSSCDGDSADFQEPGNMYRTIFFKTLVQRTYKGDTGIAVFPQIDFYADQYQIDATQMKMYFEYGLRMITLEENLDCTIILSNIPIQKMIKIVFPQSHITNNQDDHEWINWDAPTRWEREVHPRKIIWRRILQHQASGHSSAPSTSRHGRDPSRKDSRERGREKKMDRTNRLGWSLPQDKDKIYGKR